MRYKMTIKLWNDGEQHPSQTILSRTILNDDEYIETQKEFFSLVNDRISQGHIVIYIQHKWNIHFKSPDGQYYRIYMYKDLI